MLTITDRTIISFAVLCLLSACTGRQEHMRERLQYVSACNHADTSTPGQPYSLTWYDSQGRKTSEEVAGAGGTVNLSESRYDERGNQVFSSQVVTEAVRGLTILGSAVSPDAVQPSDLPSLDVIYLTTAMTYDDRGRLASESLSTGKSTTYTYTGRKVTATTNGRVYEKTYDAWGLPKQSKEPVGIVNYTYKSCGKPSAASSGSGTMTMAYDACGNQTILTDPDAGTTTYTYNALGDIISQTDARGITTRDSLDLLNRVIRTTTGSTVVNYTYGTSGFAAHRLTSLAMGNKGINYAYDQYGRVSSETRTFGTTSYTTSYTYDSSGRLSSITYPGSVTVTYGYDSYGFETSMSVNDNTVWMLSSHTGTATVETLGTGTSLLKRSTSRNSYGLLTSITLQKVSGGTDLHSMTYGYDAVTGNLMQRTGMIPGEGELFTYDKVDRLVRYQNTNGHWDDILQYGTDGNIEFKSGLGNYGYPPGGKPHAVANVTNTGGLVSSADQIITYNDLGKASEIRTDHGTAGRYTISYGPDGERWEMEHYKSSAQWPDTLRYYLGGMEGYKVGTSDPIWFYHLGHGVILRKVGLSASTQPTVYYTFEDNLGSVMRIYNTAGSAVFSAQYDPWGVQAVAVNTIGYNRGYCGHEMLNAFQLINMNGRFYDPYLGRFLSPDNYVQLPTSAQSFNRYSYCLNNPLKYVDPDGEFWWIVLGAVAGGMFNIGSNFDNIHSFGDFAKYFGVGAVAGAAGGYVGTAVAGALGVSGAIGGVISGFAGGVVNGGLLGGGNATLNGTSFWKGVGYGSLYGGLTGAVAGGIIGGITSASQGNNFWTGKAKPALIQPEVKWDPSVIPESMREAQQFEPIQWQELPETSMPKYLDTSISESSEISYQVTTLSRETQSLYSSYDNLSVAIDRPFIRGYDPRIFNQQNLYHRFPFSFDKQIVNEGQLFKMENGGAIFIAPGSINGIRGFYTIGINYSTGNIYHRCFYELSKFFKQFH